MEWAEDTLGLSETAHALRQPFEVLREVPVQATARVQKVQTGKGKDRKQNILQGKPAPGYTLHTTGQPLICAAVAEKLLQAFPPSYPAESPHEQNLRQEAYATCWASLNQHLNVSLCCLHVICQGPFCRACNNKLTHCRTC